MPDPNERQLQHELEERREREKKDLEVERTIGPRPLEGLSGGGHTTWTDEQDEREAARVHGHDEQKSRELSEGQVTGTEDAPYETQD